MIAYQHSKEHKKFIEDLKALFISIEQEVKLTPYSDAVKYKEETKLPQLFKEVDSLLEKRFKAKFRHNIVDEGNYGILLPGTVDTRDIIKNSRKNFRKLRYLLTKGAAGLKPETKRLYSDMYDNISKMTRAFRNTGVGVNLKTAEFINFPDDVIVDILISPDILFNKMKFNYKTAMSALLHEISHLLTFIEYSDLVYHTSIKIDEVYKSGNKNRDIKIMKVVLNDEDIKENNIGRLYTLNAIAHLPHKLFNGDYSYTRETERVADMGAIRLWREIEMGEVLNANLKSSLSIKMLLNLLAPALLYLIIGAVLSSMPAISSFFFIIGAFTMSMAIMTWLFLTYVIFTDKGSRAAVYDSYKYRLKRMKTSLIEVIRSGELPKDESKDILEQIEYLENLIEQAEKKYPWLTEFLDHAPFNKSVTEYYKFEDGIIDLMENDLYATHLKLLIQGDHK